MASYSLSDFKIRLIYSILNTVFNDNTPLDKAYAYYFHKIKLENKEQALIITLVNDMMRRLNYYCYIAGYRKIKDGKRHINRLICALHLEHKWPVPLGLSDCDDFNLKQAKLRYTEAQEIPNLKFGCPTWLDTLGEKELGEQWEAQKEALAKEPERFIRINTLKVTLEQVKASLQAEGISTKTVLGVPNCLRVVGVAALFKSTAFKQGWFEQQDKGSQLIAPFLDVKPGLRVVDACAGAGGKTLHLSALMNGKGMLIAMDDKEWKLKALKERAKRAGAFNIDTRCIDSTKVIKRLYDKADRLLLDVPCSGLGVLKRNADTKWVDQTANIQELLTIQADILQRYSRMVAPNGLLVYSTCSILKSENQDQVAKFLANNPTFILEAEQLVLPSEGGDGFYMARLRRTVKEEQQVTHEETTEAETESIAVPETQATENN